MCMLHFAIINLIILMWSLDILQGYLNYDPKSIIATNLKACNNFQLYSGKGA